MLLLPQLILFTADSPYTLKSFTDYRVHSYGSTGAKRKPSTESTPLS